MTNPQKDIESLFFELIRVAIGTQDRLSRIPTEREWGMLYQLAKKQSLLGVCFAGIERLDNMPPQPLYLRWLGISAKIQQRNEVVNRQCIRLQDMLAEDGFRSCILKGQGVAQLYPEHLRNLRQSGDIDIWAIPENAVADGRMVMKARERRTRISSYCQSQIPGYDKHKEGYLHTSIPMFDDTDVEWHFTPSYLSSPFANRRLQRWCDAQWGTMAENPTAQNNLCVPSLGFNLVFLLLHIYRHMLFEGVGLRQVMDYNFALQALLDSPTADEDKREVRQVMHDLELEMFAGALMWVVGDVFYNNHLPSVQVWGDLWLPNERLGRRLLELITEGGNFGHSTEKYKITGWDKPWSRLSRYMRRNWFLLVDYPGEIMWSFLRKLFFNI